MSAHATDLNAPRNDHATTNSSITYVWTLNLGANKAELQFCRDTNCASLIKSSTYALGATSGMLAFDYPDTYYWRVRELNAVDVEQEISKSRVIMLDTGVDQAVANSPAGGHQTVSRAPILAWAALSDSVGIDSYAIELSKSSAFTPILFSDTVAGDFTAGFGFKIDAFTIDYAYVPFSTIGDNTHRFTLIYVFD